MATTLQQFADQEAARETVIKVSHYIDQRRWPQLRSLFADAVVIDYTSLFGGEVQTQNANDLVDGWQKLLTPLSATQHLLGPLVVDIRERAATVTCHVRGYHYLKGLPGGGEWMVSGHYVFELAKEETGWRIQKMQLQTFCQTGNVKLLEEAASLPR
jgi:hypothetical protein